MLSREWFSAAELAAMALPGMPNTRVNVQRVSDRLDWCREDYENKLWRKRAGRGGGVEFHYSLLPQVAQVKLALDLQVPDKPDARAAVKSDIEREEMWARYARQPDSRKAKALYRLETLQIIDTLVQGGIAKLAAIQEISRLRNVTRSSIYAWEKQIEDVHKSDWLAYLMPRHTGRTATAECSGDAWEFLKVDYLRPEAPTFEACFRRLQKVAEQQGWTLPSAATMQRRLNRLPAETLILTREGEEALKRSFPAQQRDHAVFHALEAVNADTHKWDVFVKWPDGTVNRPQMVAIQDLYSGKILAWRVDQTPNKEALRLAIGDMVERFGVPDHCWFDNGRSEASKWISGGAKTRYRFKIKDDEPLGVLPSLGVQVHFTTPYHGQSKPIERAFRDFAGDTAKHPKFAGAYTGNTPMAKPENYGNSAVPLDVFLGTVGEAIREHNARPGRRSPVCAGRSFDEAFRESYVRAPIRKASADQRRLWLMAAEQVGVRRQDGTITLMGNRYWGEFLVAHRGQKVTVRFDPQALHQQLHVYRLDGTYLAAAECLEVAGFADAEAAHAHARTIKAFLRAQKALAEAERSMTLPEMVALLKSTEAPDADDAPEAKVVRPVWGNTVRKPQPIEEEEQSESERLMHAALAQEAVKRGLRPRLVEDDE